MSFFLLMGSHGEWLVLAEVMLLKHLFGPLAETM
jgi:hypothetical protein